MHKLTRPELDLPSVLDNYDYTTQTWDDFSTEHKKVLWKKFYQMQGYRCAYCEKTINPEASEEKHIEHFKRKGLPQFRHLTFEWTNLFGSCCVRERCGIYKDKQAYEPNDLIKMDVEDPEHFFTFLSTGAVAVNINLNKEEKKRAEETLRVFNLNPRRNGIKTERQRAIESHQYLTREMMELINSDNDENGDKKMDFMEYVLSEYLKLIENKPFETAIKHVLLSNWKTKL